MENISTFLFVGLGAAILAAVLFGFTQIIEKVLTKTKKLPLLSVLTIQYILIFSLVIIITFITNNQTVNPTTIFYGFIGAIILSIGIYFHVKAITIEDFSLTLPFLALTPLFLIPVEYLFFKQTPSPLAYIGIAGIVIGTFWLGYIESKEKKIKWDLKKGSKIMILVALIYSLAGNIDKAGTLSSTPLGYLSWSYLFIIINYIFIYNFAAKKNPVKLKLVAVFKNNWPWFLAIAAVNTLAMIFILTSYQTILINYAVSIKRAAFLIPIMLGPILFKEKNLVKRLPGVLTMLGGAIIIILFG